MSDNMYPIPFGELMNWILEEEKNHGAVFGVARPYRAKDKSLPIFTEKIETPLGPAAGPHTQLAQNQRTNQNACNQVAGNVRQVELDEQSGQKKAREHSHTNGKENFQGKSLLSYMI